MVLVNYHFVLSCTETSESLNVYTLQLDSAHVTLITKIMNLMKSSIASGSSLSKLIEILDFLELV